jgi:hypothetical protein
MTITTLIINELKYRLEDTPVMDELHQLSKYLGEHTNENSTMADFEMEIWNWVKDNTVKCSWCGKRHIPSAMFSKGEQNEYFCDAQCQGDFETEHGKVVQ